MTPHHPPYSFATSGIELPLSPSFSLDPLESLFSLNPLSKTSASGEIRDRASSTCKVPPRRRRDFWDPKDGEEEDEEEEDER